MAAVAMVVMNLGGLIPVATFVCPMICMLILAFVCKMCGRRIGWAWYGAVAILSMLMAPDKEAAAVFAFLGSYPIIKPGIEKHKGAFVLKLLYFNVLVFIMYGLLIRVLGMDQIVAEYQELGIVLTGVMLVMGNATFFLLDRALNRLLKIK